MKIKKIKKFKFKSSFIRLGLLLVTGFLFIFSSLSILYYDSKDISWIHYDTADKAISNILGSWGANIAATYFYYLGFGAYLVLIFLAYLIYFLVLKLDFKQEWEKILGFLGLNLSLILLFKQGSWGYFLRDLLSKNFDNLAINIIGFGCLFASLILIIRFSFIEIIQKTVFYLKNNIYIYNFFNFIYVNIKYIALGIYSSSIKLFGWVYNLATGNLDKNLEDDLFKFEYEEYDNSLVSNDSFNKTLDKNEESILNTNKSEVNNLNLDSKLNNKDVNINNNINRSYKLPDLDIFTAIKDDEHHKDEIDMALKAQANTLTEKLKRFGVFGKVVSVEYGPVVSLFEFQPHIDSKVSKITALENDLALALETTSLRIIVPIPGKPVVGFEVANQVRKNVYLGEIISDKNFRKNKYSLPLVLGKDTIGKNVTIDLLKMPHLLIAGSTGSGKSVALNTMLTSLLCSCDPDQLKLILVDPKRLEFAAYDAIPHLLFPIATEPNEVVNILKWVVQEMERRYKVMAEVGSKNIIGYQEYCKNNNLKSEPFIVVVIDELADLMMTASKEVETLIIRIAQKARAAGIHLMVATQRPSVDVITGLIKINFPSRISFRVASKADSRTVLDVMGAEKLLGMGDMLFLDSQSTGLKRIHGAYVSDDEVRQIVQQLLRSGRAEYLNLSEELDSNNLNKLDIDNKDILLPEVLEFLKETSDLSVSISLLQRRFRIGYNRSARIIDTLEVLGYILVSDNGKSRKINKSALQ